MLFLCLDSSVHIVAEFPHCSVKTEVLFTNSPLTQSVHNCLLFRPFYEMKFKEDCGLFSKHNVSICISNNFLEVITVTHSAKNLSLSLLRLNCKICVCYLSFSQLDVPSFLLKYIKILLLYSFHRENKHLFIRNVEFIVS